MKDNLLVSYSISSLLTFPLDVSNSPNLARGNFDKREVQEVTNSCTSHHPTNYDPISLPPASVPLLALRPPNAVKHNQLATLQRCLHLGNISGMFNFFPYRYGWFVVRTLMTDHGLLPKNILRPRTQ